LVKNWRWWVLIALFLGPYLGFMGLGFLWLKERGWVWVSVAGGISIISGIVFTLLMSRWTKSTRNFLPPIDWDAPQTFSAFDRQAWDLVEAEAEHGESLDMNALIRFDTYIDTGRRLATRLAAHYHPLAADPIERVPVVELITALELAAEDLAKLSRQVPGGDLVTPADWKRAVVAAGYIQKASDLYTYLLPLFNPITGLPRIASQHLMVKPAWKSMQQNVLRWFYRAFVNRLGTHLVELYSGRLSIGADHYRKLTRKARQPGDDVEAGPAALVIDVAGARGSGKSRLIEAIEEARKGDPATIEARLGALGGDMVGLEWLREARLVEVDGYTTWPPGKESARGRSTRRHAVAEAAESDLLILTIDVRADSWEADEAFLKDWTRWYADHPGLEIPPVMVVVTHVNSPTFVGDWRPPHDWTNGRGPREVAVRSKIQALRASMPPTVAEIVAAAPGAGASSGVVESVLPPLTRLCHRAERNALIRNLRVASARSRAGRLVRQVGRHGRSLWKSLRDRGKVGGDDAA
jgi:uncharacterized protein